MLKKTLILCVLGLLCSGCLESLSIAATRTVVVTTTVKDATGNPITGLATTCEQLLGPRGGGVTDTAGRTTISIQVEDGPATAWVRLQSFLDTDDPSVRQATGVVYKSAIQASHFEQFYRVEVAAGGTAVSCNINGVPAVRVTGRSPTGNPSRAKLYASLPGAPGQVMLEMGKPEFIVRGVRHNAPALVAVTAGVRPNVKLFELTAAQTVADVDLGDVIVADQEGSNTCQIQVTDPEALMRRPEFVFPAVTLVSEDRSRVLAYVVNKEGKVLRDNAMPPRLVAGRYAVLPGGISNCPATAAAYGEMKKTGSIPANIPTIEVTVSGSNTFSIAITAARDASLQWPAFP